MDAKHARRAMVRKVNELVRTMDDLREAAAEWSPDDPDEALELIFELKEELQLLEDALQSGTIADDAEDADETADDADDDEDRNDDDAGPLDFDDGGASTNDEE